MAFLVRIAPHGETAIYLDQQFYELIFVRCRQSTSFPALGAIASLQYKSPSVVLAAKDLESVVHELARLAGSGHSHHQMVAFSTVCTDALRNGHELIVSGDMFPELPMGAIEEAAVTTPAKRRRRFLFTAFSVVFASLLTWWHWPRGDARFVGTWELPRRFGQKKASIFQFQANGQGRFTSQPSAYSADQLKERAFRWWLADDVLYLDWQDEHGLQGLYRRLQSNMAPHFGLTPWLRPEPRRIYNVQPGRIAMDDGREASKAGWPGQTVLTRIFE